MRVLVTGAFGNVGQSTLLALRGRGHTVRASDLNTPANRRAATRYPEVEAVWGDLRRPEDAARAVEGQDVVLHLAGIIPPVSEKRPQLAHQVNVGATGNLLEAMKRLAPQAGVVLASSVSVFGPGASGERPAQADDPLQPTDHYSSHKVEAERMVQESGLRWAILRLNAAMPIRLDQFSPIIFEIGLESPLEFVHTRDVGLAFANAIDRPDVWGKVLLIAGGETCRTRYRAFFAEMLGALGVGMLPEEAFGTRPFYTGWMDTRESQAILGYQRHTVADYIAEMRSLMGWRLPLARLARPAVRAWMLSLSPHWRSRYPQVQRPHPAWWAVMMSGMALTTLLALWPAAHALVLGVVASVLTLPIVRAIFAVAVLLHLSEATAAAVLAWRSRERKRTLGWTAQTLLLGYPSLRLLLQRLAPRPSLP